MPARAGEANQVMGRVTDTMDTIGQSSREIVAVIETIPFQTSILAQRSATAA